MLRIPACRWLLLGALLAATACTTHPDVKPTGTVPIVLAGDKKAAEVTAKLQNLLVITMPATDPGHVWQISFHDPRFLKQMTGLTATGGATATVSFLAVHGGRTRLRFVLLPSSVLRNASPIDQQEIVLTIL